MTTQLIAIVENGTEGLKSTHLLRLLTMQDLNLCCQVRTVRYIENLMENFSNFITEQKHTYDSSRTKSCTVELMVHVKR